MNKIVKQEIIIVENREGAIFKVGDVIIKDLTNRSRSTDFTKPSTILSFKVSKRKDIDIIHAITDFKYDSGSTNKNGISIDKVSLYINTFPRCFKIRSLGSSFENASFIGKLNNIIGGHRLHFSGGSSSNSFYYLNLDNGEKGCISYPDHKFEEVTIEQFLKYCEDEKI